MLDNLVEVGWIMLLENLIEGRWRMLLKNLVVKGFGGSCCRRMENVYVECR